MRLMDLKIDNLLMWDGRKRISWDDVSDERIKYIAVKDKDVLLYDKNRLMKALLNRKTETLFLAEILPCPSVACISGMALVIDTISRLKRALYVLVTDEKGVPSFVLDTPWLIGEVELTSSQRDIYYKILHDIEEEVFLTDADGNVIFMNPHSEKVCGIAWNECVGHNIRELVEKGVFSESMTLEVIAKKQKVEKVVEVLTGRHIISTAIPLYDDDHNLQYVLCTSKDVKELNELVKKNISITEELYDSKREVEELKARVVSQKDYIFESPSMQEVKKTIMKIAPTDVTVLIEGESGAGKEVVADMIHSLSRRNHKPFMKVNCGLIPAELLESELFGYMPGAFSGASKEGKIGIIEAGNKGTIFLDEIGEMPLLLQVKLLEFLQDRKIMRVGGIKKIPIDVRVVAATNRDLKEMVKRGEFRKDLYYRLNVMPIYLEPLQNRKEDILPLAQMFLRKYNDQYRKNIHFAPEVLNDLQEYSWPGNVRELMHVIERFVVSCDGDTIERSQLRFVLEKPILSHRILCTDEMPLQEARDELDQILVTSAMERYGSTRKAAEALGVNQSTVVRILNKKKEC